jgi:phosphatidylglycerol:prolipoprotein diacylglycerol transferase
MITIPVIPPAALNLFGLEIRWYALAYVAAFIVGLVIMKKLAKDFPLFKPEDAKKSWDDLLTSVILGTILGGRLGYVLFYNLPYYLEHPLEILAIWHGGMAFHGGLLGILIAVFLFAYKRKISGWRILDMMTVIAPIGLFFGRIANFINMEVMGRATTRPWGIVFEGIPDQIPRHASPLYEAALEGIVLFLIMLFLWKKTNLKKYTGATAALFAILYALFRIFVEQFREPDAQVGFLTSWGLTMGMLLSFGMLLAGTIVLFLKSKK